MRRALTLMVLFLAGCPLTFDRHRHDDHYSYCDETGCYDCDSQSCAQGAPGYGGACNTDWECLGGYDCQNGACVRTSFCDANGGCPSGQVCDSRTTCVKPGDGTSCKADTDCKDGFCDTRSGLCMDSWACRYGGCGMGFTCDARGICVPAPCSSNASCMAGCYCANGGSCVETMPCSSDADCQKIGMVCDKTRQTCTPPTTTTPPPNNNPPPGSCMKDTDCASGQTCSNGTCTQVVVSEPGLTCTSDGQCGGGVCRPNYLGEGLCHKACAGDGDCGTGDSCQGGYCFTNPTPVITCIFNVACGDGYTCINATCHTDCTTDDQCANPADFCDMGICQPDWRRVSECTINTDCTAAGAECVNGECLTRCIFASDCAGSPSGPTCVNGYCTQ